MAQPPPPPPPPPPPEGGGGAQALAVGVKFSRSWRLADAGVYPSGKSMPANPKFVYVAGWHEAERATAAASATLTTNFDPAPTSTRFGRYKVSERLMALTGLSQCTEAVATTSWAGLTCGAETLIQQVIVCGPQPAGLICDGDVEAGTTQGKMTCGLVPPEACLVAWTVTVTAWPPAGAAGAAA